MKIYLITPCHKMPQWISQGHQEFVKRLPHDIQLELIELPPIKRHKSQSKEKLFAEEYLLFQKYIPSQSYQVALDEDGELWNTRQLAQQLQTWQLKEKSVSLLIGGPDGLPPACLQQAKACWSLSRLTFPHGMVRVIIAEQIYRAHTLLVGHPYHRE